MLTNFKSCRLFWTNLFRSRIMHFQKEINLHLASRMEIYFLFLHKVKIKIKKSQYCWVESSRCAQVWKQHRSDSSVHVSSVNDDMTNRKEAIEWRNWNWNWILYCEKVLLPAFGWQEFKWTLSEMLISLTLQRTLDLRTWEN
jgi:hypothetical protein